jgi:hypothetical protein
LFQQPLKICAQLPTKMAGGTVPGQFVSTAVKKLCAIVHKNGRWDGSGALGFSSAQKSERNCAHIFQKE